MSAFLVSQKHICYIISCLEDLEYLDQDKTALAHCELLYKANFDGVNTMYGKDYVPEEFEYVRINNTDILQCIKLIHCLDYQSCDSHDWNNSWECKWLKRMEARLVRRLPNYDDLIWEL